MRINRRRDPHDLSLIGVDRDDTGDARTPFGNRASLIDSERLELADCFKKCTAFDEHAAAGHRRQTRNNRHQRGRPVLSGGSDKTASVTTSTEKRVGKA